MLRITPGGADASAPFFLVSLMNKIFILCFFLTLLLPAVCLARESCVGFIWHYPFEDTYTADLEGLGATVMNSRIPWAVVEPREGEYDFGCLDRQLALARSWGFRLILIIEFNPVCKPGWLYDKVRAAGETTAGCFGQPGQDTLPSPSSPICREAQERLVRALTEYLAEKDPQHTVIGYEAGVEWWHNMATRYGAADLARFREWLKKKYGSAAALNAAWGTDYGSIEEAQAPPLDVAGGDKAGVVYAPVREARNIAWYNARPYEYSGEQLEFSAEITNRDVNGSGSFLTIAWFREGSLVPIASTESAHFTEQNGRTLVTVRSRRPDNAVGFSIYMLLVGSGEARFDHIRITGDEGEITMPDDMMVFDPRTKTPDARGERSGSAWIIGTDPMEAEEVSPVRACDFQEFWQELSAEYLNSLAAMVKKYDRSRFLMSFQTLTFAYFGEWDYNTNAGFLPDKVFRAGESLDILGMQLPGAEGDPYRIACGMDLARKYRKPLCNIDLIDFNGGGLVAMDKVKQMLHTSVMHGADHIMFCNYEGYDENAYRPYYTPEEIRSLLEETRIALEAVKGFKPEARVAILDPYVTPFPGLEDDASADPKSFMGWYKLLEDRQIETDILTFGELDCVSLGDYDALILPQAPRIPDEAFDVLSRYEGLLVCVKGAGLYDKYGVRRPAALSSPNMVKTEDYGLEFARGAERRKRAGDTPPMLQIGALSEEAARAVHRGLRVLDGLQPDRIRLSRTGRVMRLRDKEGRLLIYALNMSGEENTLEGLSGAREIVTERGPSAKPVFDSFCIVKF